jgi:hypothetical protein
MQSNAATILLLLACFGSVLGSPTRSYAITEDELKGKTLLFAETVATTSQVQGFGGNHTVEIYMRIGHYDFGSSKTSVQLNYYLFPAGKNKQPSPHPSIYRPDSANTGLQPWKIMRPVYDKQVILPASDNQAKVTGTWEADGPFVRVTIAKTTVDKEGKENVVKTVHEWRQDKDDPTLFTPSKPFYNGVDGSHVIEGVTYYNNFGFAYLTDDYKVRDVEKITRAHLHDHYTDTLYHHDINQVLTSGWSYGTSIWVPSAFKEYAPMLFGLYEKDKKGGLSNFAVFLLNDAPHSNLIIYGDGGHDSAEKKNECYDEGGHTFFSWGVWNPVTSKIDHIVGIEYSADMDNPNGKPMLSVFRRDRTPLAKEADAGKKQ